MLFETEKEKKGVGPFLHVGGYYTGIVTVWKSIHLCIDRSTFLHMFITQFFKMCFKKVCHCLLLWGSHSTFWSPGCLLSDNGVDLKRWSMQKLFVKHKCKDVTMSPSQGMCLRNVKLKSSLRELPFIMCQVLNMPYFVLS